MLCVQVSMKGEPPFEAAAAEAGPAVWPAQLVQRQADNCITVPAAVGRILCPDATIDVDVVYRLPSGNGAVLATWATLVWRPDNGMGKLQFLECWGGPAATEITAARTAWCLNTHFG